MAGNTSAPNGRWIQDRLHVQGPWVETMCYDAASPTFSGPSLLAYVAHAPLLGV